MSAEIRERSSGERERTNGGVDERGDDAVAAADDGRGGFGDGGGAEPPSEENAEHDEEKYRKPFSVFDKDGSGSISIEELTEVMKSAGARSHG